MVTFTSRNRPILMRSVAGLIALAGIVLFMSAEADGAGVPKIDLRYYSPPVVIGRTTNWAYSDGSTSSTTLMDVSSEAGGLLYTTGTTTSDGTISVTQILEKRNKTYFAGFAAQVASGAGFILWPRRGKPTKLQPLVQKFGKTYRSKLARGDVIDLETQFVVGRFARREVGALAAFEPLSTPAGEFGTTLRQDWATAIYFDFYYESDVEVLGVGSYWFEEGEGVVAETQRTLIYQSGVLASDSGFVDGWRVSVSSATALAPINPILTLQFWQETEEQELIPGRSRASLSTLGLLGRRRHP